MKGKKILIGIGIVADLLAIYFCIQTLSERYRVYISEKRTTPIVSLPKFVPVPPQEIRNILFRYRSRTARVVEIIGDFNDWTPEMLEKRNYDWEIVKQLTPGEYLYNFVVDGRPILDPYNTRPPKDSGRGFLSSVLIVEALKK